jgi:hypothetical protein
LLMLKVGVHQIVESQNWEDVVVVAPSLVRFASAGNPGNPIQLLLGQ